MRKLLLFLPVLVIGLLANAQSHMDNRLIKNVNTMQDRPVVVTTHHTPTAPTHQHKGGARAGALHNKLNSVPIGTAGNLLSVIEGGCNQLDVNDTLNMITFIHRNDPSFFGSTVSKYRYDVSKTRGNTWTTDIGTITNDPSIVNVTTGGVQGRFPQAVLFNPAGNHIQDSAYLVYSGTWHDNNTWCGQMRGRGKLSGDTTTYNVHIDALNNKHVAISTGMCKGAPGVFWNLNIKYSGTFATAAHDIVTSGFVVQKGVWDANTRDVVWTDNALNQVFASEDNGGFEQSAAGSYSIAFDPTGQKGWIVILGDITPNDVDSVYDPIFWKTIDGGANWTGPIRVDLDDIQGLKEKLGKLILVGNQPFPPSSGIPTAIGNCDLAVDANGNPHLMTVVGNAGEPGDGYTIQVARYNAWDITYNASNPTGCEWKGIYLGDVETFRGNMATATGGAFQTTDNRGLISSTEDGTKLFFFWLDSDPEFLLAFDENAAPNLFGKGYDVTQDKVTPVYNFTEGDSLWGGETADSAGGVFGGAIFPTVSPTALINGNVINIPLVLTQVDYNHDPQTGLGSSEEPAAFWYVNNLDFSATGFTLNSDQIPPTVTLTGPDTVTLLVNTSYTEQGATAFDCTDGVITPTVVGAPNTGQVNEYHVLYIAVDAAGNRDTVTRVVIVGAPPVCEFTWSFPTLSYRAQFLDQTINNPATYIWTFGDASGSTGKNPFHIYGTNGTFNVCLRATNSFGQCPQVCHDVVISGVGIEETEFSRSISLFPNPTNGRAFITIADGGSPDMTVSVLNTLGETVLTPATYKAGVTNIELNVSSLANGMYIVKIESVKGLVVKTLSVSK